jgi:hypothetical protein
MGFGSEKHRVVTVIIFLLVFFIVVVVVVMVTHGYRLYLISTSDMCQCTDTALS